MNKYKEYLKKSDTLKNILTSHIVTDKVGIYKLGLSDLKKEQ